MSSHQFDYLTEKTKKTSGYLVGQDELSSSSDTTTTSGESVINSNLNSKLKDSIDGHLDKNDVLNDSLASQSDESTHVNDQPNKNNLSDKDLEHLITNIIDEHANDNGEKLKNIEHEEFIEATGDSSFNSDIQDVPSSSFYSKELVNEELNYVIIESEYEKLKDYVKLDDSISSEDQVSKSADVSETNEKSFADEQVVKNLNDSLDEQIRQDQKLNESADHNLNDSTSSNEDQNQVKNSYQESESNQLNDSYDKEVDSSLNESRDHVDVEEENYQQAQDSFESHDNLNLSNQSNQEEVEQEKVLKDTNLNDENVDSVEEFVAKVVINEEKPPEIVNDLLNESSVSEEQDSSLNESYQVQQIQNLNDSNSNENQDNIINESIQEEVVKIEEKFPNEDNINVEENNNANDSLNESVQEENQLEVVELVRNLNDSHLSEPQDGSLNESFQEQVVEDEDKLSQVANNLLNESNVSGEPDNSLNESVQDEVKLVEEKELNESNVSDESVKEVFVEHVKNVIFEKVINDLNESNEESSSVEFKEEEEKITIENTLSESVVENEAEQVDILEKSDNNTTISLVENEPILVSTELSDDQTEEKLFDKVITELNNETNLVIDSSNLSQVVDEIRETYIQNFKLNETQFDLVNEFFNKNKNESGLLSIDLLRELMSDNLKNKEQLNASEDDVWRALQTIDQDNDTYVNLDEFLSLLLLFYSSKHNLNDRLASVLRNMYQNKDAFSSIQSSKIELFFDRFFGSSQQDEEAHFEDDVVLQDLVNHLTSRLGENVYVKW